MLHHELWLSLPNIIIGVTFQKNQEIRFTRNLPDTDCKNYYRSLIMDRWKYYWKTQASNKLFKIKKEPSPWSSSHRESRREEVIITRLRIGHTRITHSYLVNQNILLPPTCPHCQIDGLTVEHIFSCPNLQPLRSSLNMPSLISQALKNNSDTISLTIQYLRQTRFLPFI